MHHPPDQRKGPDSVDAEIRAGGIEDLPARANRYGKAKKSALDVADYMKSVQHLQQFHIAALYGDTLADLRACGDYLVFRHYFTVNQLKLHGASLCRKSLLCQLCAIRRGSKALQAYSERWKVIHAEKPLLRPFMVTLTVKDGPDLFERFCHLKSSLQYLFKKKQLGRSSSISGVQGAVWSYEFKRGKGSSLWHPHVHMIALAESAPSSKHLAEEWHNITGDSYIVDVRPIEYNDGDSHISGFLEVFKYALKFSEQSPADTVHAWLTLKGRNLLGSSGCFRGVKVPESLLDEPLEDLPYVDHFLRYCNGEYIAALGSRVPLQLLRAS